MVVSGDMPDTYTMRILIGVGFDLLSNLLYVRTRCYLAKNATKVSAMFVWSSHSPSTIAFDGGGRRASLPLLGSYPSTSSPSFRVTHVSRNQVGLEQFARRFRHGTRIIYSLSLIWHITYSSRQWYHEH